MANNKKMVEAITSRDEDFANGTPTSLKKLSSLTIRV